VKLLVRYYDLWEGYADKIHKKIFYWITDRNIKWFVEDNRVIDKINGQHKELFRILMPRKRKKA